MDPQDVRDIIEGLLIALFIALMMGWAGGVERGTLPFFC